MSLKSSISGIRGIIGESLTPQVIIDYVSAFSSIITKGQILLGRDSRVSGRMLTSIVKGVLNALGRSVVDIGIVPTPVVAFGVANGDFVGGIIITASHNPEQWNALKFVNEKGKFLSQFEFNNLLKKYEKKDFNFCSYEKIGNNFVDKNIQLNHIDKILKFIDVALIKKSHFKVALDAVNGAGGPHTIDFLKKLGCNVIPINTDTTGIFSHPPEPTPANLSQLSDMVKKHNADIGFALDPDADRLVIADKHGKILSEELTLALCVKHYLENYNKSDVVINMSTSKIIEDIANKYNCNLYRVPTGEINVTEKMEEIGSNIGGEGNGGVILLELNKCRDSLVGIALILEMLSKSKKYIHDVVNELPEYVLIKEKISSQTIDFPNILKNIKLEFKHQKIDTKDGIRIDFNDKWALVRMSNTEPVIRIFAEAKSEKEAQELISRIKNVRGIKK